MATERAPQGKTGAEAFNSAVLDRPVAEIFFDKEDGRTDARRMGQYRALGYVREDIPGEDWQIRMVIPIEQRDALIKESQDRARKQSWRTAAPLEDQIREGGVSQLYSTERIEGSPLTADDILEDD